MTRLTRHPGLPLLLKREMEKRARRRLYLESLAARDLFVAAIVLLALVVVAWGGR